MNFVRMGNDEDWLLRPIMRGLCRYESLKDGTLDLADFAVLNQAIDVESENARRLQEAQNGK